MAQPIEELYRQSIRLVLRKFIEAIPAHAKYLGYSETEQRNILDSYERMLRKEHFNIISATAADITHYLNFYTVRPKGGIDEFKAIYFTGMALSRFLNREGLLTERKLQDHLTIAFLDYRLSHAAIAPRALMTKALLKIADENQIIQKLGDHGMYLMYKCVHNAVLHEKN